MTLSQDRKTDKLGSESVVLPSLYSYPVASGAKLYGGAMIGLNAGGFAVRMSASTGLKCVGRCERQTDNTAGGNGALVVPVAPGAFYFDGGNSGDTIAQKDIGSLCYAIDDNTVGLTDGSATRSVAGLIVDVRADGQIGVLLGASLPSVLQTVTGIVFQARGVVTANVSNLAAFTVASNDGLTYAKGEVVLLAKQTTAAQNGLYVVGTVGSGTAPLTRISALGTGASYVNGMIVEVSEGTVFHGSTWKAMCTGAKVVGTDDPLFYPRIVKGVTAALSGTPGTITVSNLYVFSAASVPQVCANTVGGTQGMLNATVTAGQGSGTIVITSSENDTSTVNYLVANF